MKSPPAIALISIGLAGATCAKAPTGATPEMNAVLANDRAYKAAYEKRNVKALADFFTEDAQYTTEDGRTVTGRAEIEETIRIALLSGDGGTIAISVDSLRVIAPEVLVQKGSTTITAKSGEKTESLYTAIHVKKDGNWKISELVESPMPAPTPHDQLSELAWLIGEWEESDKSNDLTVHSEYVWARRGNFITRNVTVKRAGETTLEGWQIIGWDPVKERIRSWTFDSEGGYAEAVWTRDGDRWLLRETGVTPDGSRTGAENTLTKLSADRIAWESNNRTFNGEPQPNIGRIEINRTKGE